MRVELHRPDDLGRCRVVLIDPPKKVFFGREVDRKSFTLFVALDGQEHPIWTEDGPLERSLEMAWTGDFGPSKEFMDAVRGFAKETLPHDEAAAAIANAVTTWARRA